MMFSPKSVNIGYLSTAYHTSFILRGRSWIENKLNVKANWKLFGGGPAMVKAFEKGEVDIGYIGLPPTIIGIDRGIKLKCVAGGHMEGTVLVAKASYKSLSELKQDFSSTFRQFTGGTIGLPPKGSIHDVIIRHYLKESGCWNKIRLKNFDWADFIPDAMKNGEIDGAAGTPALAVLCARSLKTKLIIPPDKLWPYNPSYGIVASKQLIASAPKFIEDFLRLHETATMLIRKRPELAAELVSRVVEVIDKEFVLDIYKISSKYCASLSSEYINSTMAFIPVLQKFGYISRKLTRADIFDLRFIRKVHPQQPHY